MYHLNEEIWPEGSFYTLEKLEGEGQTAAVYRALRQDRRGLSRQTVALKILKDGTSISTLRREFEALAQVNSPHCVRVLGWENLLEGPALVLEWVDGVSLLRLARFLEFSPQLIDEVVAQVQLGLNALQNEGLFHGDLSPANILIDRSGCVRLIDFSVDVDLSTSKEKEIRGTPAFLAPEIWSGARPCINSDLFSLGLIALDLPSGFASSPQDAEKSRRRVKDLDQVESKSKLLHKMPSEREFLDLSSRPDVRKRLADGVTSYLQRQNDLRTQSLSLVETGLESKRSVRSGGIVKSISKLVASFVALTVASAIPVRAEAPPLEASRERAALSIHTNRWIFAELNGKTVGYAPIALHGLAPGPHRLTWRTKSRKGELRLNLKPGSHLKLTEQDIVR